MSKQVTLSCVDNKRLNDRMSLSNRLILVLPSQIDQPKLLRGYVQPRGICFWYKFLLVGKNDQQGI